MEERYEYMDWLRVCSIIAVVGIHVASKIISSDSPSDWAWLFANAIDSALRWCVPIFFMLSGALLLTRNPEESVWSFLKKRLAKVIIPLFAWSAVYLWYRVQELGDQLSWIDMLKLFVTDDVYYHLWFLYTIIGLYLMAPFLRLLVHHMDQRKFIVFLVFWFFISGVMPFIPKFFGVQPALEAGLFQPYIGYFMLGAYLTMYPLQRKWLPILAVLALLGYVITAWGTVFLTEQKGSVDQFFYEHYRPHSLAITLFVFLFFQQLRSRLKPNRLIRQLSLATLGIYVSHPIIQNYLAKVGVHEMMIHPAIGIPLSWFIIFTLAFALTWILQRIPVINHLVP